MCAWRAEGVSKGARQRMPGLCCHRHIQASEDPVGELVVGRVRKLELISMNDVFVSVGSCFRASFFRAMVRKSSLLL